jgi:hypothetical protein
MRLLQAFGCADAGLEEAVDEPPIELTGRLPYSKADTVQLSEKEARIRISALVQRRAWQLCYLDFTHHVQAMHRALKKETLLPEGIGAWAPRQRGPSTRERELIAIAERAIDKCAAETLSERSIDAR